MDERDRTGATDTIGPEEEPPPEPAEAPPDNRWLAPVIGVALFLVLLIGAVAVLAEDPDEEVMSGSTTTVSEPAEGTTSTTAEEDEEPDRSTTTTESALPTTPIPPVAAIFPPPGSGRRFDDPVELATTYATEFVGFTDPVIGPYLRADVGAGEVGVRPVEGGPVSIVYLRQHTDGAWIVIGTATNHIQVARPVGGNVVASPLSLQGRSDAFEGTVGVEVRQDGSDVPLATGFVTGGAGQHAPFDSTLAFGAPTAEGGAVLFRTESPEDGRVWEASVVRVRFR